MPNTTTAEQFVDKNGKRVIEGDSVIVGHSGIYSGDMSRYRSQRYGRGMVTELNIFGAYVCVEGGDDTTWTTCSWDDNRKARRFSELERVSDMAVSIPEGGRSLPWIGETERREQTKSTATTTPKAGH